MLQLCVVCVVLLWAILLYGRVVVVLGCWDFGILGLFAGFRVSLRVGGLGA